MIRSLLSALLVTLLFIPIVTTAQPAVEIIGTVSDRCDVGRFTELLVNVKNDRVYNIGTCGGQLRIDVFDGDLLPVRDFTDTMEGAPAPWVSGAAVMRDSGLFVGFYSNGRQSAGLARFDGDGRFVWSSVVLPDENQRALPPELAPGSANSVFTAIGTISEVPIYRRIQVERTAAGGENLGTATLGDGSLIHSYKLVPLPGGDLQIVGTVGVAAGGDSSRFFTTVIRTIDGTIGTRLIPRAGAGSEAVHEAVLGADGTIFMLLSHFEFPKLLFRVARLDTSGAFALSAFDTMETTGHGTIRPAADGGYFLLLSEDLSTSEPVDVELRSVDDAGNVRWRLFGADDSEEGLMASHGATVIENGPNGELWLAGTDGENATLEGILSDGTIRWNLPIEPLVPGVPIAPNLYAIVPGEAGIVYVALNEAEDHGTFYSVLAVRRNQSGAVADDRTDAKSATITSATVSPNPALDETRLFFTLARSGRVRVELFDAVGRSNGVLRDEIFSDGENSVAIVTETLEAGAYFVRITSGWDMRVVPVVVDGK